MADMMMMNPIVSCQLVLYNGLFRYAPIEVGNISQLGFSNSDSKYKNLRICLLLDSPGSWSTITNPNAKTFSAV